MNSAAKSLIEKIKKEEVWFWQGDGDNRVESLLYDVPVIIDAGDLSELISISNADTTTAWSVFNSAGAEIVSSVSFDDAMSWLSEDRIKKGWTAVCVLNTIEQYRAYLKSKGQL